MNFRQYPLALIAIQCPTAQNEIKLAAANPTITWLYYTKDRVKMNGQAQHVVKHCDALCSHICVVSYLKMAANTMDTMHSFIYLGLV